LRDLEHDCVSVGDFYLNSSMSGDLMTFIWNISILELPPWVFFCLFPHEHLNTAYLFLQFQVRKELVGCECVAPRMHSLASISFMMIFLIHVKLYFSLTLESNVYCGEIMIILP